MSSKQRLLVVFDFDHTLVDENTDYYINKLAPDEQLPAEVSSLYRDNNWIDYVAAVLRYLFNEGRTREDILDCVAEIPLTEGMKELLELKRPDCDIDFIIISDSNSVFINHILQHHKVSQSILQVFTNPASFDSDGCLTLKGYHSQDSCSLSSENLCKGEILKNFVTERRNNLSVEYSRILYVGDGYNDLCPGLTLCENDFLFPRVGFKLSKVLQNICEKDKPVKRSELKATVVPWSTGFDIINHVDSLMQKSS